MDRLFESTPIIQDDFLSILSGMFPSIRRKSGFSLRDFAAFSIASLVAFRIFILSMVFSLTIPTPTHAFFRISL